MFWFQKMFFRFSQKVNDRDSQRELSRKMRCVLITIFRGNLITSECHYKIEKEEVRVHSSSAEGKQSAARDNFPPPQYNEIHLVEDALQFISLAKQSIRNEDRFEVCATLVWGFTSKAHRKLHRISNLSAQKCTLGCSAGDEILDWKCWRSARLEKSQLVCASRAKRAVSLEDCSGITARLKYCCHF